MPKPWAYAKHYEQCHSDRKAPHGKAAHRTLLRIAQPVRFLQHFGKFDEIYIMLADAQALTDNADYPEKVRNSILTVALDYHAG